MKTIKSKQMIRRFLKEVPEPLSKTIIYFLRESRKEEKVLDFVDEVITIFPKTKQILLKTFLKEASKLENSKGFKMFILDDEGIEIKDELSQFIVKDLLNAFGYDRPMIMN